MDKILILGGTHFIGRNLIERLSFNKNYDLTIFNRGLTNPTLFPYIKKIIGDRNTNEINLINQSHWDYVIDLSCYFPNSLSNIINELPKALKKYIFISTCSVYQNENIILRNEDALINDCNQDQFEDQSTSSYGNRKAECERILQSSRLNFTILRPALVYGKYDSTDRFYYWLHQAKKYDQILIPNNGKQLFSVTYVKDLVDTIEKTITEKLDRSSYNITTTKEISIEHILNTAIKILDSNPNLVKANSQFLESNKINQWIDMPLWIDSNYFTFDNKKILDNYDLKFTGFKKSVIETIKYYQKVEWPIPTYGIDRDKQLNLIENLVS